jgi:predicted DNA-binding protein (MmcQ/YjbR family)
MARKRLASDAALKELRAFGLAYPGAHTKSPWPGHLDLAVNDKTFAYLSLEGEPLGISCKLPRSRDIALMLPFCKPTGYGLGKSGWVSAQLGADEEPPVDLFKAWIDESYRAQAPKKLVVQLDEGGAAPAAKPKAGGKPATGRKKPTRPASPGRSQPSRSRSSRRG